MPEIKVCGKCGSKNPVANNFCENCGAKLPPPQADKTVKTPSPAKGVKLPNGPSVAKSDKPEKIQETSQEERSSSPSSFSFSWLPVIYAVLLLITVFTRFHHLGAKPHHHDESMHAFYSYQLFKEGDYKYDPMMHGPFQFHGNALMYYLFGVSNATSRYLAAFFGILTVVCAMFLGPFFGRVGALLATTLIVFSPSFMYFDRFTREDAYICGATFLMVVFLFRYLKSRKPLDLWISSLGFVIAFSTKESIFLTVAVIGTYLFIRLLPWFDVAVAAGLTAVGVLTQLAFSKQIVLFLLFAGCAFAYTLFQLVMRWIQNLKQEPENDLWDLIVRLGFQKIQWEILALAGWWVVTLLAMESPFGLNVPDAFSVLLLVAYIVLLGRFFWLWLNNTAPALTGSLSIFGIVFTLLFTTFFTVGSNQSDFSQRVHDLVYALYNGAFGGLKYWWGQHDVHRGDEPWYYYVVQLPANEMVSFLFSIVAMVYYGLVKRRNLPLFLAYWYVGSLALFSWAGEKMPWLIIHPLLPSLLLTAYFIGDVWDSKPIHEMGRLGRIAALLLFGLLAGYSLHSAVLLNFYHEANPVEPLVYVQTGTDVKEVERIIREISYGETGGPDETAPQGRRDNEPGADKDPARNQREGISMTIEDKCSWPFAWYLRDFPRRAHPPNITVADNPIILTGTEADNQSYPVLSKAGYVNRKYMLRVWWAPSWFKKGFPGAPMNAGLFFDWLFGNFIPIPFKPPRPDMVDWNDLKKWLLYREVWSDLGSYNMRMWIRPDIAQKYGFTETDRLDVPADYPKPEPVPAPTPVPKKRKG